MSELLATFHAAILANDVSALAPALKLHPRLTPAQQFAIYADGYRIRLVGAIASDYPLTRGLLGAETFDALAQRYVALIPPTSYSLDVYPHAFGGWLADSIDDRFAGELARLEAAVAVVFMLPDSAPLAPNALSNQSPDAFGATQLRMRTALQLMACHYPVNDWMSAARAGENPPRPAAGASFLLLIRHNNEVQRIGLTAASYALLQAIASKMPVGDALDAVIAEDESRMQEIAANLQPWFAHWMANGVFADSEILC
jgi:hypothetical protein